MLKFPFLIGNCVPLDNTIILNAYKEGVSAVDVATKYDLLSRGPMSDDHDYFDVPFNETLSEFKDTCVAWISGATVKALSNKMDCEECLQALSDTNSEIHSLNKLKRTGILINPSESVVNICREAEKCFGRLLHLNEGLLPQGPGVSDAICYSVLYNTKDMELFPELRDHQLETTVVDNHRIQLVKKVAAYYIKVRLYHLGKTKSEVITGLKIRHRNKKLTLFNHQ